MKTCTLCGGKLDRNNRCTFCGLDNSKNDEMYKQLVNQNDCADEPLTHVHKEHTYSKPIYTRSTNTARNVTRKSKKPEKKLSAVISLIVSVIVLANTVYQCAAENRVEEVHVESEISQGVTPDPYQGAQYDLPEEGDEYYITLYPGAYVVGTHIPEGTYEAYLNEGQSGYVEIRDAANDIYIFEKLGEKEEQESVADLRLYQGGYFVVSTGIVVELESANVQSTDMISVQNYLAAEPVIVKEKMVVGEDFPGSAYDILYTPADQHEAGSLYCTIPIGDMSYALRISFNGASGNQYYYNLVLPEGAEIEPDGLEFVTLTPSPKLSSLSINSYYDTYWK